MFIGIGLHTILEADIFIEAEMVYVCQLSINITISSSSVLQILILTMQTGNFLGKYKTQEKI